MKIFPREDLTRHWHVRMRAAVIGLFLSIGIPFNNIDIHQSNPPAPSILAACIFSLIFLTGMAALLLAKLKQVR